MSQKKKPAQFHVLLKFFAVVCLCVQSVGAVAAQGGSVNIKFLEGTTPQLPLSLAQNTTSFAPLFTLPVSELEALQSASDGLPDLTSWYRAELKPTATVETFIAGARALSTVAFVEVAAGNDPPPTPDLESLQLYLGPATNGLDAQYAWTLPDGDGTGVTIYDIEYAWNQTHEDISYQTAGLAPLVTPGDANLVYSFLVPAESYKINHGTAVAGILIGEDNGLGVKGVAYGATIQLVPEHTNVVGHNRANAIALATADAAPGDVLLYEMQKDLTCGAGMGPAEWEQTVFEATQVAVANGLIVVAAAGNGHVDLDSADCNRKFDRTFRDSGAILVGAGLPPGSIDRAKANDSSYGTRVDVQGWSAWIHTAGFGTGDPANPNDPAPYLVDPTDPNDPNLWYTNDFDGTSGASAIVAGIAADLQGFFTHRFGVPITAFQMRKLLTDTGSPQQDETHYPGHIGPRPNLRAAIDSLTSVPLDIVFLVDTTGSYSDDLAQFQAQAPGIINTITADNANVQFALAAFQDYPIAPFGLASLDDKAYELKQPLTDNVGAIQNAINDLSTSNHSGDDAKESQLTALYQLATGDGQTVGSYTIPEDQNVVFREGATKIILLWTDDAFHLPGDPGSIPYPGNSFVEAATAIAAIDPPQVLGISAGSLPFDDLSTIAQMTGAFAPPEGVDCDNDGYMDVAPGDPMVCMISTTGAEIGDVVLGLVEAGIDNRTADLAVDMSVDTPMLPVMRVGQSAQITVSAAVSNLGPSGPVDADLAFSASDGYSVSASPSSVSYGITDLSADDEVIVSQSFTVTCEQPGLNNLTISSAIQITSPIDTADRMPMNNSTSLSVSVNCLAPIFAERVLDLRNRVKVYTSVYGGNDFRCGTDVLIDGNVLVNGTASLWSNTHINGSLTTASVPLKQDGVVVTGPEYTTYNGPNERVPSKTVTTGTANLNVPGGATRVITPGNYADGTIGSGSKVYLAAGTYNFTALRIQPDAKVYFNTTAGAVEINVQGVLELGDRVKTFGGTSSSVALYSNTADTLRIGTDVVYRGSLRAPFGTVNINSRTTGSMSIWAKNILIEPDTTIHP